MKCDDIDWLVDMLGTMELLESVINDEKSKYVAKNLSERGPEKSAFKGGAFAGAEGVYFVDGHWYSYRASQKKDSYTENYQIRGTAHFCQTFATLIFLGVDKSSYLLKANDYAGNIKVAMKFWMDFFGKQKEIARWIVAQMTTDRNHLKNHPELASLTVDKLLEFMLSVSVNADSLTGCREG